MRPTDETAQLGNVLGAVSCANESAEVFIVVPGNDLMATIFYTLMLTVSLKVSRKKQPPPSLPKYLFRSMYAMGIILPLRRPKHDQLISTTC
jgi:hypothetical protein